MKMASQRFCLRWNNHQSNLLSVFDQLLHAETFTDVTLAVEGQYLKAHKMVLSACSPYFNALFVNHPEKHPIVILKDVPYSDMKSLLDFMYRGEVSVDQERLTAFLRVAESLRIKGLTEVNDDKPSTAESTPAPPQLQRIQPYLVPQRNRSQANLLANPAGNVALQAQPSLLSSALMPKRKRGRPRKLSGSSNGTGNDYDEYEREGIMNDSDVGNGKLGNESYSGNDDGSDDNQLESGNNDDLNESRDSLPTKRSKSSKEQRMAQQDDNSTSELSQRLFGTTASTTAAPAPKAATTLSSASSSSSVIPTECDLNENATSLHLPTILGLRIRPLKSATQPPAQQPQQQQQQQNLNNANSLLKQQLRGGAKDPEKISLSYNSCVSQINAEENAIQTSVELKKTDELASCSALQSLANAAEQQASKTNSNSLHHQLLLHMAANPLIKQQQPSKQSYLTQPPPREQTSPIGAEMGLLDDDIDLLCMHDQQEKPEQEPELSDLPTLADEQAGLPGFEATESPTPAATTSSSTPKRPIQRRRVRRKAQSTLDDQAEHLTEMSVRGLDLFRYASLSEGLYQCTECAKENMQKTFKNKYSFQRHAFLYHEGKHRKVFPCPICSKEFSRPDKMKNHLKVTHENFTPPKGDMAAFSPLKFLITAAAAGDMPSTFYPQQELQPPEQEQQPPYDALPLQLSDVKQEEPSGNSPHSADMLMLHDDVIIKNEIQISPSPSPSPPATCGGGEGQSLSRTSAAQAAT